MNMNKILLDIQEFFTKKTVDQKILVTGIKQQKKAPEIFSDTFFSYTIFMLKRSVLHESAHAPILEFFHAKCLLIYELDHVLLSP